MKGLLRGMVAVGLLAGGVMGLGCSPDKGPRTDTSKSPVQTKYQTPETQEAQPVGEGPISRPTTEDEPSGNDQASSAQGGSRPHDMPAAKGLGRGMDQYGETAPAQEGFGGAGQETGATSPQQDSVQKSPAPPRGE
jgi:hypothetical protein